MKHLSSLPAMIALAAALSAPLIIEAQNSYTPSIALAATTAVAGGPRADGVPIALNAAVYGAAVYGAQNERLGSIADVPDGNRDGISGVVLALGGDRGITGKLVEIPRSLLRVVDDRLVITDVTRDQLMQLPAYRNGSRS